MMPGAPAESPTSERRAASFAELVSLTRGAVESKLREVLDGAVEEVRSAGPDAVVAIDALRTLCMRGGKRFRPVLIAAAHEACGGGGSDAVASDAVVLAGAAIELLQAYLLIHDDWMDGDDVRRGGPSVHAMLRTAYGDLGEAPVQDPARAIPPVGD